MTIANLADEIASRKKADIALQKSLESEIYKSFEITRVWSKNGVTYANTFTGHTISSDKEFINCHLSKDVQCDDLELLEFIKLKYYC